MSIKLFNNTAIMEKALDASWMRNEAIASNLANVDTPGYKRQTVEFESFLSEAMGKKFEGYRTNEKHIPIGKRKAGDVSMEIRQDSKASQMRIDKNNVDIDVEMALLSKNNIYYNAVIQQLTKQFSGIKSTIASGGR
ncbi:MAG: flagellar basal body rod protein FlgB [Clostridia bacterium]